MADILKESQDLRESVINALTDKVPDAEKRILKGVFGILDRYEQAGGKFQFSEMSKANLIKIQNEIEGILKKEGYFKAANVFVADLSKITANTLLLQKGINGLDIQKNSLTGIEKAYQHDVVNKLSEAGLNQAFVAPVTQIVNEAVTFGYSIDETRKSLENIIVGTGENPGGKLNSYLTVTARDTVTQMQGAQHQAISNDLAMPWIRYVGGLIKDSRGQCVRWHDMGYISRNDLAEEIALAYSNASAKLEEPRGHKWSGMIKGTTPDNFLMRRGGWGCLHQAIGARSNPKMKVQPKPIGDPLPGTDDAAKQDQASDIPKFQPAKDIKAAEAFVRDKDYADKVSYKGANVSVANEMNASLEYHMTTFPELRPNMQMVGTSQEVYAEKYRMELNSMMEQMRKLYGEQHDEQTIRKAAERRVGKGRSSGEYAFANYWKKQGVAGISVNKKYASDPALFTKMLTNDVEKKYHPIGCNTVKSVFDHELAHQLDNLVGLRNDPDFLRLYNQHIAQGREYIRENLSGYAWSGRNPQAEFIAEAWAEYQNNPHPRQIARELAELLIKKYNIKFKKP